jgi:solute carrier family 25 phosphate transporter 3
METLMTKEVTSTSTSSSEFKHPTAFTAHSKKEYGLDYFLRGALAGGICCGVTHGALTPVDVVKTRMQLDPSKYSGMISGAAKIAAEEGAGALLTGLAPTCFGYFVQGWFKFGGVEYFKIKAVETLGEQKAWDNKTNIYLGAAAGAEFIADVFLCPLEATRIRLVSNPSYASSMPGAMAKMASEEGHRQRVLFWFRSDSREADSVHDGEIRRSRRRGGRNLQSHGQNEQRMHQL